MNSWGWGSEPEKKLTLSASAFMPGKPPVHSLMPLLLNDLIFSQPLKDFILFCAPQTALLLEIATSDMNKIWENKYKVQGKKRERVSNSFVRSFGEKVFCVGAKFACAGKFSNEVPEACHWSLHNLHYTLFFEVSLKVLLLLPRRQHAAPISAHAMLLIFISLESAKRAVSHTIFRFAALTLGM